MSNVLLISAPPVAKNGQWHLPNKGVYPNLGIHSLYSYLRKNGIEIGYENVLDGEIISCEEIADVIRKRTINILGCYVNVGNYNATKELCKLAKSVNNKCVVILGGPLPTTNPLAIMVNNDYVDAVVAGDGEQAVLSILENGGFITGMPGLYFRRHGEIVSPEVPLNHSDIDILPYPLEYVPNLDKYAQNSPSYFSQKTIAAATYFHKTGCIMSCPCCCIPYMGKIGRSRTPRQAWEEVAFLHDRFGVSHVYEVSDNILSIGKKHEWFNDFSNLSGEYNSKRNVRFRIYASTNTIDSDFVKRFSHIGGDTVAVGFESGADLELSYAKNKSTDMQMNRKVLQLIKKNSFKLVAFFMIGLPHTSMESTLQSLKFIKEVLDYDNVEFSLVTLTIPLPKTKLWQQYIETDPFLSEKYWISSGKLIEPTWENEEIARDFIEHCPDIKVEYGFLKEIQREVYRYRPEVYSSWTPELF